MPSHEPGGVGWGTDSICFGFLSYVIGMMPNSQGSCEDEMMNDEMMQCLPRNWPIVGIQ